MKRALQQLSFVGTIFLIGVGLLGCSSPQHRVSGKDSVIQAIPATPVPTQTPKSIADENFEKEWKSQYETAAKELEKNRRLWKESKIVDYDFICGKITGGGSSPWNRSPVVIKVRDGVKTSLELEEKNPATNLDRLDGFEEIDTIDRLFDYMLRELENGKMLNVTYHIKFGYPKNTGLVFANHSHGSQNIYISRLTRVK